MIAAALIALALAADASALDPCTATDRKGRTFRTCFDPGNALDLSAGGAWGREEPARGGASDLRLAWRWRKDLRTRQGSLEWLRDMTFVEARALFTSAGGADPRAASVLAWRGTFVRHRASPFLLVPGPRLRLPFPFDVGLLLEAGGASWDAARRRDLALAPVRSALLLDLGARAGLRRLAFGPEAAWTVRIAEGQETVQGIVPFTGGVIDARAESGDGLSAAALVVRGGSVLSVPGGTDGFLEARLALERVVLAVNDRPLALYAEGTFRGGASGRGGELAVGLRAGLGR